MLKGDNSLRWGVTIRKPRDPGATGCTSGLMPGIRLILISLVVIVLFQCTHAQRVVYKQYKVDGANHGYYLASADGSIKGIVILFPGRGESAKGVFKRTSLPDILRSKGYSTIVPELQYSLFVTGEIDRQLHEILQIELLGKPGAPTLALGGFSAGGALAISYAAHLLSHDTLSTLKSVFVIDPPLDLKRIYETSQRWTKLNCSLVREDGYRTIGYLDEALGGSPTDNYDNYVAHSPFLASESDGGNARWLMKTPIRLYTEPDVQYVRTKVCKDLSRDDLNVTDLERLDALLKASGNTRCQYIVTNGRGYHSWNIAEPTDLSDWIVNAGRQ